MKWEPGFLFLLLLCNLSLAYWNQAFTEDLNCVGFNETQRTENDTKPVHKTCKMVDSTDDPQKDMAGCIQELSAQLDRNCKNFNGLSKIGEFSYCRNSTIHTCCSAKAYCHIQWKLKGENLYKAAVAYLENKDESLRKEEERGFNTCHHLGSSLDATVCNVDCIEASNSTFAQSCRSKNGFFKCCIRRSSAGCHECRFCCSLLLCSFNEHDGTVRTEISELPETRQETSEAAQYFLGDINPKHNWENFGCLNPRSAEDPTRWGTYEPHELGRAMTERELESAKTYKYERMHENFEDPDVLRDAMDESKQEELKKAYGWDFIGKGADMSQCLLNCEEAQSSKFARNCRKKGGLFKCCVTWFDLFHYAIARKNLNGKYPSSKYEEVCNLTDQVTALDTCRLCFSFHSCTMRDPSQLITIIPRTPDTDLNLLRGATIMNPSHHGIFSPTDGYLRMGARGEHCMNLDTCLRTPRVLSSQVDYFKATSPAEFCALVNKTNDLAFEKGEALEVEPEQNCLQRENINIRVCPAERFASKGQINPHSTHKLFQGAMETLWDKKKKKGKNRRKSDSGSESQEEKEKRIKKRKKKKNSEKSEEKKKRKKRRRKKKKKDSE